MTRRSLLAVPLAAQTAPAKPTVFRYAGMTLPWMGFPLERALEGVRRAGFEAVAWGTTHMEGGVRKPVLDKAASAADARALAARCRDMGLPPVMMFADSLLELPEAAEVHLRRVEQAAAAGIPHIITFGRTGPGQRENLIAALRKAAPAARAAGVTFVIKQHGGNTGTGVDCARIIEEIGDEGLRLCYDAGNVLDYDGHDPLPDIRQCWRHIRAFAIKDHRNWPKDEDCGPGYGEIDHYRLFEPVMHTGLTMPLAFENIFEPLRPRPADPAEIDRLALRAREYVRAVLEGLAARRA